MDSKVLEELGNLKLTEDESRIVGENFEATDEESMKTKISFTLVGKLLTVRPYNVEAMKRTLLNVWRVKDNVAIRWDAFLRIKILVDINKPLRRGLRIANGSSSPRWCGVQYERLADFCYYCGRLSHTDVECQFVEEDVVSKEVVYEYGPWLGASPKKQIRGAMFDREREKSWLSKIKETGKPRLPGYFHPKAVRKGPLVFPRNSLSLLLRSIKKRRLLSRALLNTPIIFNPRNDGRNTLSEPWSALEVEVAAPDCRTVVSSTAHNGEDAEITAVQHVQCLPLKTWKRVDRDVDASMMEHVPIAGKRKFDAPISPTVVDESSFGKRPRASPELIDQAWWMAMAMADGWLEVGKGSEERAKINNGDWRTIGGQKFDGYLSSYRV
uniref:Zinc knuckle CX2CX4HX4C domain-containing protein n=1 Tax=Chenopodium quinoa TaxID=63459 RepID=A0A803MH25_CHEQI